MPTSNTEMIDFIEVPSPDMLNLDCRGEQWTVLKFVVRFVASHPAITLDIASREAIPKPTA
jgi:hypothetical protein